jgi:hypothetical protein
MSSNPRAYLTLKEEVTVEVVWNDKVVHTTKMGPCTKQELNLVGIIPEGEAGKASLLVNGKKFPCSWELAAGWTAPKSA